MNQTTHNRWQRWLPTPGTILFTLLVMIATGNLAFSMPSFSNATTTNTQANLISYQGYLTNSDGTPVNGSRALVFKIYDAPTGGNLLWGPENHSAVSITMGLFDVQLGSLTTGGVQTTAANLYLEISVNNEPLSPRELLNRVGGNTSHWETLTLAGPTVETTSSTTATFGNITVAEESDLYIMSSWILGNHSNSVVGIRASLTVNGVSSPQFFDEISLGTKGIGYTVARNHHVRLPAGTHTLGVMINQPASSSNDLLAIGGGSSMWIHIVPVTP